MSPSALNLGGPPIGLGPPILTRSCSKRSRKFQQEHGLTADGSGWANDLSSHAWTERESNLDDYYQRSLPTEINRLSLSTTIMLRLIGLVLCFQLKRME